jgi:hypothetical protein
MATVCVQQVKGVKRLPVASRKCRVLGDEWKGNKKRIQISRKATAVHTTIKPSTSIDGINIHVKRIKTDPCAAPAR